MQQQPHTTSQPVPGSIPPQHQVRQPGDQSDMDPQPIFDDPHYRGSGKLQGKVAIVTGADSGIGRAVAVAYAKEGADVAIVYLNQTSDAEDSRAAVEKYGRICLLLQSDLRDEASCAKTVQDTLNAFEHIDILVNNIAVQHPQNSIMDISLDQLENTFRTNVFSYFHMAKAVVPHLRSGGVIINTASVTAYKGSVRLIDYSSTKGAIVSFTRSLSLSLVKQGIRVNAVAPGPVWTPLIPSSFTADEVQQFGKDVPLMRPAQPFELAPVYVYLASEDSSYVSGQVLHVNGGTMVDS